MKTLRIVCDAYYSTPVRTVHTYMDALKGLREALCWSRTSPVELTLWDGEYIRKIPVPLLEQAMLSYEQTPLTDDTFDRPTFHMLRFERNNIESRREGNIYAVLVKRFATPLQEPTDVEKSRWSILRLAQPSE